MIFFKKDPNKLALEEIFRTMRFNLENNYKDNALNALKELEVKCEELKPELKEKDYAYYRGLVDQYKERLKDYHH